MGIRQKDAGRCAVSENAKKKKICKIVAPAFLIVSIDILVANITIEKQSTESTDP